LCAYTFVFVVGAIVVADDDVLFFSFCFCSLLLLLLLFAVCLFVFSFLFLTFPLLLSLSCLDFSLGSLYLQHAQFI